MDIKMWRNAPRGRKWKAGGGEIKSDSMIYTPELIKGHESVYTPDIDWEMKIIIYQSIILSVWFQMQPLIPLMKTWFIMGLLTLRTLVIRMPSACLMSLIALIKRKLGETTPLSFLPTSLALMIISTSMVATLSQGESYSVYFGPPLNPISCSET